MKLFLIALLIASALAEENYNGPEWAPSDASLMVPVRELPGFWEGRVFPKSFYTPNPRAPRVVGGQPVTPHAHPYMVALNVQFPFGVGVCGGSILGTQAILTAAHCLIDSTSTIVIAGVHNRHINEPTQQRRIVNRVRYVSHPNFNFRNFNNDVAVLHMDLALPISAQINLVRLPPPPANELYVGESARSLGWGRTTVNGPTSSVLLQSFNPVLANAACVGSFPAGVVVDSTLCVSTTATAHTGACNADEGGVLSVPRPNDVRPVQIGITSFFHANGCVAGHPIGFSRVTQHLGWINNNVIPPPLPPML